MDKIVFLAGSPRIDGNTKQILDLCASEAESLGLKTEVFSLAGKDIKGCIACYQCKKKGHCVLDDDLAPIIEALRTSQGFIVGAPVYFGTARGDVMNALQRIGMVSRSSDGFLNWQVGGPIALARRGGVSNSYLEMMMVYFINEMVVPGSNYWNIVYGGSEKGSALADQEGVATVLRFTKNVCRVIEKLNG